MNNCIFLKEDLARQVDGLFNTELQLITMLPKMVDKANNEHLKIIFDNNCKETEEQIEGLFHVSSLMDKPLIGNPCKEMQKLIEESNEILQEEIYNKTLIDILLIGATQRIKNFEIAAYNVAHEVAVECGEYEVARLLNDSLKQEVSAENDLYQLLIKEIIYEANNNSDVVYNKKYVIN